MQIGYRQSKSIPIVEISVTSSSEGKPMRCYLMRDGHIRAVEVLPDGSSDEAAIELARRTFERQPGVFDAFEVWHLTRQVYPYPHNRADAEALPGEEEPMDWVIDRYEHRTDRYARGKYATEAEFIRAAKELLRDPLIRFESATLPDGTVVDGVDFLRVLIAASRTGQRVP
jgi:hypothetical protein